MAFLSCRLFPVLQTNVLPIKPIEKVKSDNGFFTIDYEPRNFAYNFAKLQEHRRDESDDIITPHLLPNLQHNDLPNIPVHPYRLGDENQCFEIDTTYPILSLFVDALYYTGHKCQPRVNSRHFNTERANKEKPSDYSKTLIETLKSTDESDINNLHETTSKICIYVYQVCLQDESNPPYDNSVPIESCEQIRYENKTKPTRYGNARAEAITKETVEQTLEVFNYTHDKAKQEPRTKRQTRRMPDKQKKTDYNQTNAKALATLFKKLADYRLTTIQDIRKFVEHFHLPLEVQLDDSVDRITVFHLRRAVPRSIQKLTPMRMASLEGQHRLGGGRLNCWKVFTWIIIPTIQTLILFRPRPSFPRQMKLCKTVQCCRSTRQLFAVRPNRPLSWMRTRAIGWNKRSIIRDKSRDCIWRLKKQNGCSIH